MSQHCGSSEGAAQFSAYLSALGFSRPQKPRMGGEPPDLLHVKCGPGVSEGMPSSTWAVANSSRAQIGAAGAASLEYRCSEENGKKLKAV